MNRLTAAAAVIIISILAGCTVGPKYQRPVAPAPSAWSSEGPWREAAPKDALPKGAWWEVFHDDQLNQYEQQLLAANQSLTAAQDRLSSGAVAGQSRVCWPVPDHEHRPQRIGSSLFREQARKLDTHDCADAELPTKYPLR